MSFEVQQEAYSGPLHLLLKLIEKKELPITNVSLAQVTDDYVRYINQHEPLPEELADFLLVATRLLLMKSYEILPREEEFLEESTRSLAFQLQLYQLFVRAADLIDTTQQRGKYSFGRLQADVVKQEGFSIPDGLDTTCLSQAFITLLKYLEPFFCLQQTAIERIMSVKERLKEIHDALLSRSHLVFRDVIGSATSKVDIVVSFLALLELVKQRTIHVIQTDVFGDIEIKRVD